MGLPKLDELIQKVSDLGYDHWLPGHRPTKAQCVDILREHYLPPGGLPYEELTPMLCFPEWKMHEHEKEKIWTSPSWVAQEKLNGVRAVVHFVRGQGVFVHTRTVSVKNYRYQEITNQFLDLRVHVPNFSATVDCEVIIDEPVDTGPWTGQKRGKTKSALASTVSVLHLDADKAVDLQFRLGVELRFQVFDITSFQGEDLTFYPLDERLEKLTEFLELLLTEDRSNNTEISRFFRGVPVEMDNKREYMQKIIRGGGEGVVLKNLESLYHDSTKRDRHSWVKAKRRMEFDAYVSGFRVGEPGTEWEGLVGSLEFSVWVDEDGKPVPHVIGYASAMTMEQRAFITTFHPNDAVGMKAFMYGRVAEISGQDISARELRLTHCKVERWRDPGVDYKAASDCVEDKKALERMAAWVK